MRKQPVLKKDFLKPQPKLTLYTPKEKTTNTEGLLNNYLYTMEVFK